MGQLFWPDREEPQFCLRLLQLPNCPLMCFCLVCSLSLPPPVLSISLFRLLWVLSSHLNFYFLSFSFIMFCLHFSVCSHFHSVGCLLIIKFVGALLCSVLCVCALQSMALPMPFASVDACSLASSQSHWLAGVRVLCSALLSACQRSATSFALLSTC